MSHEEQAGSSHHSIIENLTNRSKQKARQNRSRKNTEQVSIINEVPTTTPTTTNPGWQIVRDASMKILSRQVTKLNYKQDIIYDIKNSQTITKQYSLHGGMSKISRSLQSLQTPRMPTEEEAIKVFRSKLYTIFSPATENDINIFLSPKVTISYQLLCSFCDGPCIGDYLRCRICIKAYHSKCLFERGHLDDPTFHLPRFAKQDWSCPECSDLTRLLRHDELDNLIQAFELIDTNKDGYITLEEFLSLQSNKTIPVDFYMFKQHNSSLARKYFSLMDVTQHGVITWWDFVLFYSCKFIVAKNKVELARKLTEKEVVFAKTLFFKDPQKTFDNQSHIVITRTHFKRVYDDLILSLEKKYGIAFIDTVLGYDNDVEQTTESLSFINWNEYLHEISPLILLNRSNDDMHRHTRRAAIPPHLSNAAIVSRSRFSISEKESLRRVIFSRLDTPGPTTLPDITYGESFHRHAKILAKLKKRDQDEALKRNQMGSSMDYSIIEDFNEKQNINLPKLKSNARDDRRIIIDPWTSVRELQLLRNTPIPIKKPSAYFVKI